MDHETKVYVCRDVVFNETDFGESDHGTVLELEPSVDEHHENQPEALCPKRIRGQRDRPENQIDMVHVAHCVLMTDECEP